MGSPKSPPHAVTADAHDASASRRHAAEFDGGASQSQYPADDLADPDVTGLERRNADLVPFNAARGLRGGCRNGRRLGGGGQTARGGCQGAQRCGGEAKQGGTNG